MNTQRTTIMRGIYNNVQILGGADNKDFRSAAIISPFVMSMSSANIWAAEFCDIRGRGQLLGKSEPVRGLLHTCINKSERVSFLTIYCHNVSPIGFNRIGKSLSGSQYSYRIGTHVKLVPQKR